MKLNIRFERGFTLVELLVVIAIIGILGAVILTQLTTARDRGYDASVKSALKNLANSGLIYYETNGNYSAICDDVGTSSKFRTIYETSGILRANCNNWAQGFRVRAQLKSVANIWLCADNNNAIKTCASDPGSANAVCPSAPTCN